VFAETVPANRQEMRSNEFRRGERLGLVTTSSSTRGRAILNANVAAPLTRIRSLPMQYESLAADLKAWLQQSIDQGYDRAVIEKSMRASGYQPKFARRAIELAFARHDAAGNGADVPRVGAAATTAVAAAGADESANESTDGAVAPADDGAGDTPMTAATAAATATAPASATEISTHEVLLASPNAIETSDSKVNILFALNAPRIILFGNLLSEPECKELIRQSALKLERSTVVNAKSGAYDVHPDRTSSGTHFQRGENDLIRRLEQRISELVSIPIENGEPIQILHYTPGAEYKPHFDYFDPDLPGNEKVLAMGGQRVATLIMYLNDVEAGGSTVFPEVGVDVLPRSGNAVYFAYTTPAGLLDARTLHGGSPVHSGEKWIATKWIRLRPYRQG